MFEVIILLAVLFLLWLSWRLYQAKQYTKFIEWLNDGIKAQVIAHITQELKQSRDHVFENNEAHINATLYYYQQFSVRIFEAAVRREIISKAWFDNTQNKRHASHLLFVQSSFRLAPVPTESKESPIEINNR